MELAPILESSVREITLDSLLWALVKAAAYMHMLPVKKLELLLWVRVY